MNIIQSSWASVHKPSADVFCLSRGTNLRRPTRMLPLWQGASFSDVFQVIQLCCSEDNALCTDWLSLYCPSPCRKSNFIYAKGVPHAKTRFSAKHRLQSQAFTAKSGWSSWNRCGCHLSTRMFKTPTIATMWSTQPNLRMMMYDIVSWCIRTHRQRMA